MSSLSSKKSPRGCCWCCCCWCLSGCFSLLALLLIVCGAGVTTVFDYVFSEQLKVLMPLANGSMSYQGWEKVPSDLTFQLWVWNVTNPKEVIDGQKPKLNDVGPFTFKETRYKSGIKFFPNDTVAFREFQQFFYKPELSCCDIDTTVVTSVNMAYATLVYRMRQDVPSFALKMADTMFKKNGESLFVTRPVREILLGYKEPTLNKLRYLRNYISEFSDFVGLFIERNDTDKGEFLVHTGRGDLNKFNQIERWNGERKMYVWPTEEANRIVGTDGSMFTPQVTESTRLQIFTTDICRSLEMVFVGRGSVHGIPTLKFGPPASLMLNATLNPSNAAYCNVECLDSGVMDIARCQRDVPLALSSPHFRGAPTYAAEVEGVRPNPEFDTVIEVEPNTGFVVNAGRKMQMNAIIRVVKEFKETEKLKSPLLMPLMWLNESGGIQAEAAELFKQHLLAPIQIVGYSQWVLIGVGVALAAVAVLMCCCLAVRKRDRSKEKASRKIFVPKTGQPLLLPASGQPLLGRDSIAVDEDLLKKVMDNSVKESDIV